MRADPGEQRADGVAVADHDPVAAADLPRLRRHAEPAPDPDQGQGGLGGGAGDLERAGAAGFGERTVGQEGSPPGGLGIADAAGDDVVRQPLHGTTAQVDQAGLAGQPLAVAR